MFNPDKKKSDDTIDLKEIFDVLKEARKLILLTTFSFALSSAIISLILTDYYKSESILIVTDADSVGNLGQLGGLAAMAGVNLPMGGGKDRAMEAIQTIKSRAFLKHLLSFNNVMPAIIAVDDYDVATKKLSYKSSIYDDINKEWVRKPSNKRSSIPSYLEVHEIYLEDILSVSKDNITGLITISVEHISPIFAKEFLELIIKETNSLLRKKDLEGSANALAYLSAEIPKTSLVEIRESINQLIQAQLETQMMAKINTDYILTPIEPPFIPEERSKPNRTLIVIIATMFGGIISVLFVLFRNYLITLENL